MSAFFLVVPFSGLAQEFSPVEPRLNIPVPYVDLTAPVRENTDITVPFLAQYVSGVHQFLISVVGLVAGFMIVIGGFQYLTAGGDASRVSAAKGRILNALTGLVLAFGSYLILYSINPSLVNFDALKIQFVQTELFEASLASTTSVTALDGDSSADQSTSGVTGAVPGTHTPSTTTCPFTLSSTEGTDQARAEFYGKVRGVLTGSVRDRVVQVADIANACNVNLGSCGRTAGTILALAGVPMSHATKKTDGSCLDPASGNCNGTRATVKRQVSQSQRLFMYGWRCDMDNSYSEAAREKYLKSDCVTSSSAAIAKVREHYQAEAASGRLRGWPDQWADDLRPGDYVVIYNGNRDMVGAHAVVFVGWASDGKSMQVVQGGNGGSGTKRNKTRPGTWCVRSSCGDRMVPIAYIWSPD